MAILKHLKKRLNAGRHPYLLLGVISCGILMIGLIAFLFSYGADPPGRMDLFLGRLHPVIVHLPIGILLAVFLFELACMGFPSLLKKYRHRKSILFLLWIGFVSAVASVLAGFFLSLPGGYDASYLFWHKWLGVSVVLASGICFVAGGLEYVNRNQPFHAHWYRSVYRTLLVIMVGVLSVTGHLGGTLTHGPGYVTEYLPAFVKGPLGLEATASARGKGKIQDIESAKIYGDLVKPVLQKRCVSCHGPSKTKGELRLDSKKGIKKGGANGKVIQPGNPEESELVHRITLPPYHEKVMPPDNKKPLSIGNTELIRWWVKTGASFKKTVGEVDKKTIPSAVRTKLDRMSARPEPDRLAIYDTDVKAPKKSSVTRIRTSTSWEISYLSSDTRFLEVHQQPDGPDKLERSDMKQLKPVRNQVAWLDVRDRELTDDAWSYLEKFPMLNRLHAERTNISDRHLKHLSSHKYLFYLNLYGTGVSDSGITHLNLDKLKRLIIWKTKVSKENAASLRKTYPNLTVEFGAITTGKNRDTGIVKKMSSVKEGGFRVVADGFKKGALCYTDENFTFTNVPDKLKGETYIQTLNEYRQKRSDEVKDNVLTLTLSSPATIYVAYDTRINKKAHPKWFKEQYESTDMNLGLAQFPDFKFRMYRRKASAGKVTFGANVSKSFDKSSTSTMYVVVLVKSKK